MTADVEAEARSLVARTRRAQNLPELVEDAGVLARVARIVSQQKEPEGV